MKKIGIIGGIGPESTLDYYRGIIDTFRELNKGTHYPEIIVYSADLTELLEIVEAKALDKLAEWLLTRIEALRRAGAEFAAIASNTPHVVFDEVAKRSPLPLISIVEASCTKAGSLGVKRPGLLGTRFTMQADFFQRPFHKHGMAVVVPTTEEQEFIHEKLFSEIELGIIKDETRLALLAIVKNMIERDGIDSLILGCTELPLILPGQAHGIPFLNTSAIHVEEIVRHCLGE
ncbi:MAG: amino acid racemase [Desulfobacteraceae bacterium]|nr:amino acid racemase [Desulfobacteraceae bacterium]